MGEKRPSDLIREHELPGIAAVDECAEVVGRQEVRWRPDDECMAGKRWWEESLEFGSWSEFAEGWVPGVPGLNLLADFYFEVVVAEGEPCEVCDGTRHNEETQHVVADVRAMLAGLSPGDAIAPDEALELYRRGRARGLEPVPPEAALRAAERGDGGLLAQALNAAVGEGRPMQHFFADPATMDAFAEARARRLGVLGACPACGGDTANPPGRERLALVLWVLHPRFGASRGVRVRSVSEADLPEVRAWLERSLSEHEERFAWVRRGRRGRP